MPDRAETTTQADWPGLTLEAVLYAALVLGAALIRFFDLGRWPLLTSEAQQALAAWRFLQGQGVGTNVAPLPFDGALLSFFAFGAGDGAARLLPALLGTALVLAPLPLRRHLGRWGALAAAFMLAFSPTLVYYSRTLAGPVPALAGLGAVLWGLELAGRRQIATAKLVGGAGLVVALTSSPWAYTFLLVAAGYFGLGYLASRRGRPWPGWAASGDVLRPVLRDGQAWAVLGLLAVPLSTALLTNIGGVQATLDLFGAWLARLVPGGAGRDWLYPVTTLAYYELGVLLLGLAGIVIALRRGDPWTRFLGAWALVALVLATLSGARDGGPLALIILPLALLGGLSVNALVERLERPQWAWVGIGLVVFGALVGFWWLNLTTYSTPYADMLQRDRQLLGLLAAVTPLILAGAIAAFRSWVGRAETAWATGILGLALLASLLLRSSVTLNLAHARDARERLVVAPTSLGLKDMVRFLEDWSVRTTLDQHTLTIAVQDDLGPEVFWYLREFPVRAIRPGAAPTTDGALLLSAGQDTPALSGYVRQRYRLGTSSAAPLGSGRAALSMWLIGEGGGPVQPEAIELWVKP